MTDVSNNGWGPRESGQQSHRICGHLLGLLTSPLGQNPIVLPAQLSERHLVVGGDELILTMDQTKTVKPGQGLEKLQHPSR